MSQRRYGLRGGPFTKTHADFVHDGVVPWEQLRPSAYDRRTVAAGRRSFVLRALDEQRSLAAFSELLAELAVSGAEIDLIGAVTRVVRDEARHVDLCQRVVERLGGWPPDAPEPKWVKADRRLPPNLRVLSTIVGSMCIGETISVHMIAGVRRTATDPVVGPLLTQFLADESFHSRVGWWWLEGHAFTDEERAFVDQWLPRLLRGIARTARPSTAQLARPRPRAASPFGSMSPEERAAAFDRAMHDTILPGLDEAGIDATSAWARIEGEMAA